MTESIEWDHVAPCSDTYAQATFDIPFFLQEATKSSGECQSRHETGRICLFILVAYSASEVASQARGVGAPFARKIVPERPM